MDGKLDRFETSPDFVHSIIIMDAMTGQTISTTTPTEIEHSFYVSEVLNITWRNVSAEVDWLIFTTNIFHVDQEQVWLYNLSTQQFRLLYHVPFDEHILLSRSSTNNVLFTKHMTRERGLINKLWHMPKCELFYQTNDEIEFDENGRAYVIRLENNNNNNTSFIQLLLIGSGGTQQTMLKIDLSLDNVVRFKPDIIFNSFVFFAEKIGGRFEVSITPFAAETLNDPNQLFSRFRCEYDYHKLIFFKSKVLFCKWTSFGVLMEIVLLDFNI